MQKGVPAGFTQPAPRIIQLLAGLGGNAALGVAGNADQAGHEPAPGIEQFYAENFNDEFMANRFQSMTINPDKSVRA